MTMTKDTLFDGGSRAVIKKDTFCFRRNFSRWELSKLSIEQSFAVNYVKILQGFQFRKLWLTSGEMLKIFWIFLHRLKFKETMLNIFKLFEI